MNWKSFKHTLPNFCKMVGDWISYRKHFFENDSNNIIKVIYSLLFDDSLHCKRQYLHSQHRCVRCWCNGFPKLCCTHSVFSHQLSTPARLFCPGYLQIIQTRLITEGSRVVWGKFSLVIGKVLQRHSHHKLSISHQVTQKTMQWVWLICHQNRYGYQRLYLYIQSRFRRTVQNNIMSNCFWILIYRTWN